MFTHDQTLLIPQQSFRSIKQVRTPDLYQSLAIHIHKIFVSGNPYRLFRYPWGCPVFFRVLSSRYAPFPGPLILVHCELFIRGWQLYSHNMGMNPGNKVFVFGRAKQDQYWGSQIRDKDPSQLLKFKHLTHWSLEKQVITVKKWCWVYCSIWADENKTVLIR